MNPVASIDMVSILACLAALFFLTRAPLLKSDLKFLISGLLISSALYFSLIFVGWADISSQFEDAEDIFGAIVPMWWAFTLYALILDTALDRLADSENRFKTLVTNIPGIFYRCRFDWDWTVIFLSDFMETVTGYPASDFINNSIRSYTSIVYEPDRQRVWDMVELAEKTGQTISLEYRLIHKYGHLIWVHEEGKIIKSDSGQTLWLDGVIFDITDRKDAERQRQILAKTLASKNEELESLIYVSSHDLKSPIVNIEGFSNELSATCDELNELLAKDEFTPEDKKRIMNITQEIIPEDIRFINAGSEKLKTLLDGMLKVSRISKSVSARETIAVTSLLGSITEAMTYQIRQTRAEVKIQPLPDCVGDRALVGQVFTNLLDNALKYRHPSRPCLISVSGRVEDDRSVYCVEDNGLGIEKNQIARIFDLFHRVNPGDAVAGEGLGLTIIKRIVQLLDGDVWVQSTVGIGSKFYISLPNI